MSIYKYNFFLRTRVSIKTFQKGFDEDKKFCSNREYVDNIMCFYHCVKVYTHTTHTARYVEMCSEKCVHSVYTDISNMTCSSSSSSCTWYLTSPAQSPGVAGRCGPSSSSSSQPPLWRSWPASRGQTTWPPTASVSTLSRTTLVQIPRSHHIQLARRSVFAKFLIKNIQFSLDLTTWKAVLSLVRSMLAVFANHYVL